jgi:vitamin K-dependent gamma-carboxylase
MVNQFKQLLFKPSDPLRLNVFRFLFAFILILQFSNYTSAGFIEKGILAPAFLFHFDYLPFIKPISSAGMKFILLLTLIGPIMMFFRKTLRAGAIIYTLSFSYLFFLDQSYYNNHFYLIILLSIFWIFYKPTQDSKGTESIPFWQHFLFGFMVVLVYFYGGIVKLNSDWLFNQQPTRILLELNSAKSGFPDLLKSEFAIMYITYGGLIFDLCIGFMLIWKRTYLIAVVLTIIFHITNHFIFNIGEGGNIGIFPMMMIGAIVLFASPDKFRKFLAKFLPGVTPIYTPSNEVVDINSSKNKRIFAIVSAFLIIQLILPFRPYALNSQVHWTGQASFFGWRMKVTSKKTSVKFFVKFSENEEPQPINIGRIINTMQIDMMAQHVDMIYKFSQYLKHRFEKETGKTPIITADIQVSLNGRPMQAIVDPNTNLANITYSPWSHPDWVLPLKND